MRVSVFLVFVCVGFSFAIQNDVDGKVSDTADYRDRRKTTGISVLLVTTPDAGHLIKAAAIGEALVLRGHNVTLCCAERNGSDLVGKIVSKTGMNFLSAGIDHMSQKDYLEFQISVHAKGALSGIAALYLDHYVYATQQLAEYLDGTLEFRPDVFDIVVVDTAVSKGVACVTKKWNIPTVSFRTSLEYVNLPQWPFPTALSGYTDDLHFFQRLQNTLYGTCYRMLRSYFSYMQLHHLDSLHCSNHRSYLSGLSGTFIPMIVVTAFGFEYPRPLLPMVHYVGPLMMTSSETLQNELEEWLEAKPAQTVIYISMGSTAHLTNSMGRAILEGVMATNYSALWSLRESNRGFLEQAEIDSIDKRRLFISGWVSQQMTLKHKAIALSIIHGGCGGVTESLYNAVPMVITPFNYDQLDNAVRVQHAGAGIYLYPNSLNAEAIRGAIETVGSLESKLAAQRIQKIFINAGGAKKAAKLVEFYAEVGYDHLIPAYAKYNWSWVQYYNIDVYAVLMCIVALSIYCGSRFCCFACRACFSRFQKRKFE